MYLFNGESHTDYSTEYMQSLGMSDDAIESVQTQQQYEISKVNNKKREAYINEADPLFVEWQKEVAMESDDADDYKAAWLAKVSEIKERFS